MSILVVGGAGYIGSHMVARLLDAGEDVIVLDDLSSGFRDAVLGGTFIQGNFADATVLDALFAAHRIEAAMLFASFINVAESVAFPLKYYRNNSGAVFSFLERLVAEGVDKLVFSSTAATYGEAFDGPISETAIQAPINPYGRSKLMVEHALFDARAAHGLRFFALRYFNAAGADRQGRIGERHDPETHLIPLVLQAAAGRRADIKVFGSDWPTPDGTCLRDYIHVEDLAEAHWLALAALRAGHAGGAYNLGNARGASVDDVIQAACAVTGRNIAVSRVERRPGDPPVLIADSSRMRAELGWAPKHDALETIIEDAWRWERHKGTRW